MMWDILRAVLYIIVLIRRFGGVYIRDEEPHWDVVMKYALFGMGSGY